MYGPNAISFEQLYEWWQYYKLEPFGEERADLRAGSVVAAVYNVNLKRGAKQFTASDCALKFKTPVRAVTTRKKTKEEARADFDQYKAMVIAIATQSR